MTRRLLLTAVVALAAAPALGQSPGRVYGGADIGLSIFHDNNATVPGLGTASVTYSTGFAFGVFAGYRFGENVRLEGEIGYKAADLDTFAGQSVTDSSLTVWGFMANAYYDITQLRWPVTPFVGAGLGLAYGKAKSPAVTASDTVLGYQIQLGFNYRASKHLQLNARYLYQGSQDFVDSGYKVAYGSSNLLAGLQYFF